ncbi:MAG: tRNA pseudouridine(38-40) synthase TruA [Simkaniaceae bacterium]|nr:tRNA pseudouridine(38-40) synthase TruA [Candidatus Sacchlamyda saccharinae]
MINYKCHLSYSGTHYHGFQKTKMGPSIEELLQKALEKILQEPIKLQAASRTDSGVHAEEQVCNFFANDTDLHILYGSLRSLLPKDIAPLKLEKMPAEFHPTLNAKGKEYHYYICNQPTQVPFYREFSWHVPLPLDLREMDLATQKIEGKHDFSAFTNTRYEDPIRHVRKIAIEPLGKNRFRISIQGDNFLYKMVRNIVGTLVHIGQGKIAVSDLPSILKAGDRRLAGMTAPAHGLFLHRVFY